MSAWPVFQAQDSANDLADHPHRVQLVGNTMELAYPPLCPHCGASASRHVVVQKVFRRRVAATL